LDAFAGTVGGNSTCGTFGPPAPVNFFGSPGFGIGINGNGISDCGLAGSLVDHNAALGPLTAANSVSAAVPGGTFTGTANGTANYGVVGGSSHGVMGGITGPLVFSEAAGLGIWEDNLTYTSPTHAPGTQGTVMYTFTVAGNLTTTVPNPPFATQEISSLAFQQDAFFQGDIFTAAVTGGSLGSILGNGSYPGFTFVPGSISGSGKFPSVPITFTWGKPFDLKVGLIAEALPDTGSTSDVNLLATLTGIQILDASGKPVSDFSVASGSGAQYGAGGILAEPGPSAVPEPATVFPAAGGLFLFGMILMPHRRK
jgi:hypothetical protein